MLDTCFYVHYLLCDYVFLIQIDNADFARVEL